MKSLVTWYGGKARLASRITALLPPHDIYVEPFGGGAWVLFNKAPSRYEIYNDLDSGLVTFFRVLRDPLKAEKLHHALRLTPYSREEHRTNRTTWQDAEDEVERARRWFAVCNQSFSGNFGAGWSFPCRKDVTCSKHKAKAWVNRVERIPAAVERLRAVHIEQVDWRVLLDRYDGTSTLFYLDPPYDPAVCDPSYKHRMSQGDHQDLVDRLLTLRGMALLSGYRTPLYEPLDEAGWQRVEFAATMSANTRKPTRQATRIECVWINPAAQEAQRGLPGLLGEVASGGRR